MTKYTSLTGLALMLCVAGLGCHSVTGHDGKWGAKWVVGFEFESTATETTGVKATAGFELDDWLKGGLLGLMFGNGEAANEPEPTADGG